MKITDAKWSEIIAETRIAVDRWNASAKEKGLPDIFRCEVDDKGVAFVVLFTSHIEKYHTERKAVAREIASGEMRPARLVRHANQTISAKIKTIDPKSWRNLDTKPANEIVKALKLTNFIMVIGSRLTSVSTAAE